MKVKDIIQKVDKIDKLVNLLEESDLDYAHDVVWELACYRGHLLNITVMEGETNHGIG